MGGTEKGGGDTKILKRGQPGLRDGCLKKRGAETPLQTRGGMEGGGWAGGGGLSESVKKGKFVIKIFLSDVE